MNGNETYIPRYEAEREETLPKFTHDGARNNGRAAFAPTANAYYEYGEYDDYEAYELEERILDLEGQLDDCDEMSDRYDLLQDEINRLQNRLDEMEGIAFDADYGQYSDNSATTPGTPTDNFLLDFPIDIDLDDPSDEYAEEGDW
ncbi:MAG: hypothetical protein NC210_05330 [[Clostridium] fimetarium]|nr:hypothetical protein [Alistipes timonensis]MCM1405829.1 hypothetical protein [[Clostridium] fimetarium]